MVGDDGNIARYMNGASLGATPNNSAQGIYQSPVAQVGRSFSYERNRFVTPLPTSVGAVVAYH